MRWWRRLFGSTGSPSGAAAEEATPADSAPRASRTDSDPDLVALLEAQRASARVAALDRIRGTVRESEALSLVARARAAGGAPDQLAIAGADLHVQRGELDAALELLRDVALPAGVLLAADLHARRGALARALTLVERVLARDIDAPGARERHERWAEQLGVRRPLYPAPTTDVTALRPASPGDHLRIANEAGRGGAATVYEAIDELLGRRVALKVYHRPEQERDKLVREAQTAVELGDEGIVRVFDVDPAQGSIVMEWLAAGTLKTWLAEADQRLIAFPRWYPRLVASVAEVHRRGWVHADLKPANVLFRDDLSPVISDFGLAQPPGRVEPGGSLGYLSPERIAGRPLQFSDDVFALGRILEDTLDACEEAGTAVWRGVVAGALAEADERPSDGESLLAELGSYSYVGK